jgi:hypothetical protein
MNKIYSEFSPSSIKLENLTVSTAIFRFHPGEKKPLPFGRHRKHRPAFFSRRILVLTQHTIGIDDRFYSWDKIFQLLKV